MLLPKSSFTGMIIINLYCELQKCFYVNKVSGCFMKSNFKNTKLATSNRKGFRHYFVGLSFSINLKINYELDDICPNVAVPRLIFILLKYLEIVFLLTYFWSGYSQAKWLL